MDVRISSRADVHPSARIGAGTVVGDFTLVREEAEIGRAAWWDGA
jgi:UDP-3-O-[3-hydroxymyristoyl] glucosamine N-acyltransferase